MRLRVPALVLLITCIGSAVPCAAQAVDVANQSTDAAVAIKSSAALMPLADRLMSLLPGGADSTAKAVVQETAVLQQRKLDERKAAAARASRARHLAFLRHLATPAYGHISASFGSRGLWATRHTGIDINARYGDRVHSVAEGRVVRSTYDRAYGNIVVVRGRGVDIWYAHLSKRYVKAGERISWGQTLGRVGCTGRCYGPHLHIEVRRNDRPTDPAVFLWGSHRGIAGSTPSWASVRITRLSDL